MDNVGAEHKKVNLNIATYKKVMAPVVDESASLIGVAVMTRVARPSRPSPRSPCPGVLSLSHTERHHPASKYCTTTSI